MAMTLSVIIPTRERAAYLPHCIRTCTANPDPDLEILVLDNASVDDTAEAVASVQDTRIRYVRNDFRLSMRDNFEKGLELARGDIVCFIGDDDGLFPDAVSKALQIFKTKNIDALSAARAHYFWPDLVASRRNTALLPRHTGIEILSSKAMLGQLLAHCDYYRLPCLYHGFVRRNVAERVKQRQGRFFLSSQVDMFSSIALSMEDINYAFSKSPLIINGGSARSNGASHFGGGTDLEKTLWKKEDDLGFLPGFDGYLTVGSLIVESALRYCQTNCRADILAMLNRQLIEKALTFEASQRVRVGRGKIENEKMFESVFLTPFVPSITAFPATNSGSYIRAITLIQKFYATRPVDMGVIGVKDIFGAAQKLSSLRHNGGVGFLNRPLSQIKAAFKMSQG